MEIRKATSNDIKELASLMEQLGYQTSIEQMRVRFNNIEATTNHYTLVAIYKEKIVGMVGFHTGVLYNKDGIYARVIAFVVDSKFRNKGIGRRLLTEAESIAINSGADGIGLNSGNRTERDNAHQFYKNMGYEAKSIGFVKALI
ncbi:GNAT family N-acetyltransferase [Cytobacillus sp. FSL W7-1323]|uniref:GNAT family N-acetyltransferase n=1 Tax=Cytobacillus TaxID=2675230 RepID=UPI002785C465|nr:MULTISPECIES: GNAT family N-acetyltransferase [Cytobacillus]MDQ0188187.1 GNAT superfamily N-acetyltransferase [Cytobacillus kochii]MEA1855046.1 GNAT family N-acetyltransferase [Cytobacillus sp. OWB-43]